MIISFILLFTIPFITPLFGRKAYLISVSVLFIAVNIVFSLYFNENIHCTQYASLFNALIDFDPHPEEIPAPLIYDGFIGVLIRLIYGVLVLSIMIFYIFREKL